SCGEIAQREEARDWFRVTSPDGVKIGDFSQMRHGSFCSVGCLQRRLWEASWGQWYIDPVNGPARVPNWTPNKQED
ncbi:MAG: hypothetical protein GY832_03920, partial [Chloroflexi bacterium]|nr:hypothetical protein [Chloroflexota bacterium]